MPQSLGVTGHEEPAPGAPAALLATQRPVLTSLTQQGRDLAENVTGVPVTLITTVHLYYS